MVLIITAHVRLRQLRISSSHIRSIWEEGSMDIAAFFGIIIGFVLVVGAIFMGDDTAVFINLPELMIV